MTLPLSYLRRLLVGSVLALAAAQGLPADPAMAQGAPGGGRPGAGPGGAGPGGGAGAALREREVGTVILGKEQVPYIVTLPGRAVAFEETAVRPRVEGIIEEIAYQPGREVKVGDVLFRLGTDTLEAALAAALANRDSARAQVTVAEARAERDRRLTGVGATKIDSEASEAALAQAKAALSTAESQLKTAQLNLERALIRSPISGIAGLPEVSVGTLVTANQAQALVTITRLDPIYVDVAESSARMLRVRGRMENGELAPGESLQAELTMEDGRVHSGTGRFVSPGIQVSTTTGSVQLRFEFDNPTRDILPGQFLRVSLTLGTTEAILVPQRATRRAADGSLTAFVVKDGKAEQVTLTYTGTYKNAWITTAGVEPGDLLIVDGLNNLRAGMAVKSVPVTIDARGVVQDVAQPVGKAGPGAARPGQGGPGQGGQGATGPGATGPGGDGAPREGGPRGSGGPGSVGPGAGAPAEGAPAEGAPREGQGGTPRAAAAGN